MVGVRVIVCLFKIHMPEVKEKVKTVCKLLESRLPHLSDG